MGEDNGKKLEQNQHEKPMSFISMVIITGLVGGILWSSLALLAYVFNFTEIRPNVILEPWALGDWKKGWIGTVFSILSIGLISIGAAFVYYAFLRKFDSLWVGALYGVALFLLVFYVLNPIFPGIKPFLELSRNTLITSACFYVLFGVFIGYSISFEETERSGKRNQREEAPA
ncbi:YqhR family membrane protein [Bacillus sp. FJAT-27251]|uniref:YqhR family membrane protein n=1 Tax=Bacillus sp. FJAT-27251 TaxID=1684142 RepID=UPI0006A7CF76|nr:YqhR family membrane protein [Bacillus sp. FJAT-27251]